MKRIGLFLTLICLAITAMAQTDTPTPRGFERPRQMMNEEQRQKFHEQMEERRKRDEERRKFRMEHVEKANKSFAEAKEGKDIKVSNDYITLGQKVFALTEQKEYDQFLSTLNKLSLANGFDLRVKESRSTPGPDDTSRLTSREKTLSKTSTFLLISTWKTPAWALGKCICSTVYGTDCHNTDISTMPTEPSSSRKTTSRRFILRRKNTATWPPDWQISM